MIFQFPPSLLQRADQAIVSGEIANLDAASLHIPEALQAAEKSVKPWRPRLQCAWIECQKAEPRKVLALLSFASAGYGERRGRGGR